MKNTKLRKQREPNTQYYYRTKGLESTETAPILFNKRLLCKSTEQWND